MAMQCPKCFGKTKVVDSRPATPDLPSGNRMHYVVRRRECLSCSTRFTTWETIVEGSVKPKLTAT